MPLHDLPPELVLRVMRHIGHEFFAQNIRRLTVSKWWFRYAWTIFVEQLLLNRTRLVHFARNPAALEAMLPHLKAITIIAREFCYPSTSPSLHKVVYDGLWGVTDEPYSNSPFGHGLTEMAKFNSFLDKVAIKLHQCPRLNSVTFKGPTKHGVYILYTEPLDSLLSLRHVTSLTVTNNAFLNGFHMCSHIHRRLPFLRRFRYRTHLICEDLLTPLPDAPPLNLQDVVIDLTCPTCRRRGSRLDWEDCGHRLEEWATELASRLDNPRMVRVRYPWPYNDRTYSFDGITGVRTQLENGSTWDDEGPVIPERPSKVWDDQVDEESDEEEEQDDEANDDEEDDDEEDDDEEDDDEEDDDEEDDDEEDDDEEDDDEEDDEDEN
ncbi:hypothetical protein NEMBOFW57_009334 [Staphylotrichum longicolle]|uniref:F-box domain-containing protein n=1 Tax=Staphylotrichum longicolle TaxID=669026 RepID=A0AAD4EPA1_9PEZI|nr:hypothetical protein NEMBOFW57_009334 [Staphylotrichum longicolle]